MTAWHQLQVPNGPLPDATSKSDGVPIVPSAIGATSTLTSSMRSAARNAPLIFPPPSSRSLLMPNRSLVKVFYTHSPDETKE